jgi:hypothetical protein
MFGSKSEDILEMRLWPALDLDVDEIVSSIPQGRTWRPRPKNPNGAVATLSKTSSSPVFHSGKIWEFEELWEDN